MKGHTSARTYAGTSNSDTLSIRVLRLEVIMQNKEEEYCFSKTLMREVNMNHIQVSKQVFTSLRTSLAAGI